jgi:hypothetical protein
MRIMIAIRALLLVAAMLVGATSVHAQAVSGQGTWETTLVGRDINLNAVAATSASAVYLYDTTLNVTWLRNANVAGQMDWSTANSWAANMVTGSGAATVSDWRLPTMANPDPAAACNWGNNGTNCGYNVATSSSEMASLFFSTLGNKSYVDTSGNQPQSGWGLTNTGSFQNMQSYVYWLGTGYAPNFGSAWFFGTNGGFQNTGGEPQQLYAMAVHSGDVASLVTPVPEPETYAMLLAGLGLIGVIGRRRSRT